MQRCVDALAGIETPLAILPAGTANLLATNLGIPQDIEQAVAIGLHGERRKLDVGRFNGERFAVMAGVGLRRGDDPAGRRHAQGPVRPGRLRLDRLARTCARSRSRRRSRSTAPRGTPATASCILVGNVGRLFGGIEVFEDARPDDGRLELGVVNADGVVEWIRTLARTAAGHPERSPFVQATKAAKITVKLDRKVLYEVDGGDRVKVKAFKIRVEPAAITICVPTDDTGADQRRLDATRRARARPAPALRRHRERDLLGRDERAVRGRDPRPPDEDVRGRGPPLRAPPRRRSRARVGRRRTTSGSTASSSGRRTTGGRSPVVHTRNDERQVRLVFGSCRVGDPQPTDLTPPWPDELKALGIDALWTYSKQLQRGEIEWPDALLLLGDQVYADEVSPETLEFIRSRRGTDASRRASRSPTSRSTPGSTASRGRSPTSAGCSRPCRRR